MKYHFRIHREQKGFWAECIELKGCQTQADSQEELAASMFDALNLFLSEPEDSDLLIPLPKKMTKVKNILEVPVDPSVALAFLLKRFRKQKKLTQRQAADLMGLKGSLFKYQRLESPATANPELKTLVLIRKAFPEFNLDLLAS